MCDNQLYMDAWRMPQGLEDVKGTEKLIKQDKSQKLREGGNMVLGAMERTNGSKLIKGGVF